MPWSSGACVLHPCAACHGAAGGLCCQAGTDGGHILVHADVSQLGLPDDAQLGLPDGAQRRLLQSAVDSNQVVQSIRADACAATNFNFNTPEFMELMMAKHLPPAAPMADKRTIVEQALKGMCLEAVAKLVLLGAGVKPRTGRKLRGAAAGQADAAAQQPPMTSPAREGRRLPPGTSRIVARMSWAGGEYRAAYVSVSRQTSQST
jgi:hypothetical protein